MKTSLYHLILTLLGPHCCLLSLLVQPCPKTCTCDQDPTYSSGLRVNCSNADLLEVPWDIPVGTTTLLLRDNDLEILHNSSFASLTQLRTLDLSFNRIAHMEENAFEGLETLLLLDLRRNVLTLSPKTYLERVFQPLASLKTLFLNHNSYASAYRREPPVLTSQSHGEDDESVPRSTGNLPKSSPLSLKAADGKSVESESETLRLNGTEINTSVTGHVKDKLELSNADLTYPDDALSHLPNLVELHLDGLKDTAFGPGFRNLSNLTVLSLQGFCHLGALDNTTFLNTPHVQQLNLSECDIIEVTRDAFSTLTDLRELDLSYNQKLGLDRLGDAFEGLSKTRLERLVIDAMVPIRSLGIIVNSTHLRHFKDLNHLKVVQARFNRIEAFDDGVLCTELPPNLKRVYLNANMLVLASYVNDLKCLESLELLHINGFDTYWTPPLRPPDPEDVRTRTKSCAKQVPGNGGTAEEAAAWPERRPSTAVRHSVEPAAYKAQGKEFQVPPTLRVFKARHFGLFYKLEKMRVNPDNNLSSIDMSENHFPLWEGPITGLENLTELYLEDAFAETIEPSFFDSFPSLEILNISGNRLRDVFWVDYEGKVLGGLENLKTLDMSRNDLGHLPNATLSKLVNLEKLYLSVNGIGKFRVRIDHMWKLQHLDLSKNQINTLAKPVRDHLDAVAEMYDVTVDLSYNPIACTCQNIDFLRWVRDSQVNLGTHRNYFCQLSDGSEIYMNGIQGTIDELDKTCGSYVGVFVGAVASSLLFVVLLVVALAYRFRWKLRYLYYATRLSLQRDKRHHDDGFKFDAFVSFAGEDMEFVDGELKEELEEGRGLKLCIHERDFVPGQYIASNIVDSVQRSRRTLVVLTRALLASDWCHYELQMALMEAAETGRDVLLFLLYEHVPSHELPREVLFNIQAASYIEFPHSESDRSLFWDRLADALRR